MPDEAPGGNSARVALAALDLTHRDGHTQPAKLEPDKPRRARLRLPEIAQALEMEFGAHRVALATATDFSATATEFVAEIRAGARLGGTTLLDRRWTIRERRDFGD